MAVSKDMNELTIKEVAQLAGVTVRKVEKSCEEGVVHKRKRLGSLIRRSVYCVPVEAVAYNATLSRCTNIAPNKIVKKRLWNILRSSGRIDSSLGVADLGDGLLLNLETIAGAEWVKALRYVSLRNENLVSDPSILGGEPVIRGTRITCRSVKGRIDAGDTIEDLVEECNGDIPTEVFEAALTYANSHPVRGRPELGKPWRET